MHTYMLHNTVATCGHPEKRPTHQMPSVSTSGSIATVAIAVYIPYSSWFKNFVIEIAENPMIENFHDKSRDRHIFS